jgi:hypothetical protein
VLEVYPIPEELTAPSALGLILCFRGYEYCKSRLGLLPSSPARQVEAASGVHGGRASRNSLPASAVTLYTRLAPATRGAGGVADGGEQ